VGRRQPSMTPRASVDHEGLADRIARFWWRWATTGQ
jgi:hypothetical protein